MPQTPKTTARDVFWYLLMIVTLYIGVVSFIALLFQYVNLGFPDPLEFSRTGALSTVRISMASLIVVVPVYLFMSSLIERDLAKHPDKQGLRVRKWLLYLTLFIASITIIIDLITLLNGFLSGELTVRFFLKILIILAVAAAVFGYYLWDLKRDPKKPTDLPRHTGVGVGALVILAIAGGFFFVGSPAKQRAIRFDERRVNDLQTIQFGLVEYWRRTEELPASLAELDDPLLGLRVPTDPATGEAYEYRKTGDLDFELCAEFAEPGVHPGSGAEIPRIAFPGAPFPAGDDFAHDAGRQCFERTIDPERLRDPSLR